MEDEDHSKPVPLALEDTPEYKAWLRRQSGLAKWAMRLRAQQSQRDEETAVQHIRRVVAGQYAGKAEGYLLASSAVRPQAFYRGHFPHTAYAKANGMFMSPYEIRYKELSGELIKWNQWHSWDLTSTYDPRNISDYPRPTKYNPLNPPRPSIRAKRLERQAASHE